MFLVAVLIFFPQQNFPVKDGWILFKAFPEVFYIYQSRTLLKLLKKGLQDSISPPKKKKYLQENKRAGDIVEQDTWLSQRELRF